MKKYHNLPPLVLQNNATLSMASRKLRVWIIP